MKYALCYIKSSRMFGVVVYQCDNKVSVVLTNGNHGVYYRRNVINLLPLPYIATNAIAKYFEKRKLSI